MQDKYNKIKNIIQKLSYAEKNNYEIRYIELNNIFSLYYYNKEYKRYDKEIKEYIDLQAKDIKNKDFVSFLLSYPYTSFKGLYYLIKMIWRAQKTIMNLDKNKLRY